MADSIAYGPQSVTRSGSPGDPGSHLQFQISLLRLVGQKWVGEKWVGQQRVGEQWIDPKSIDQKAGPNAGSSVQVLELERLQHPCWLRRGARHAGLTNIPRCAVACRQIPAFGKHAGHPTICRASGASRVVYNREQDFFMLLRVLVCWASLLLGVQGLSQRGFAQQSASQPAPPATQSGPVWCSPVRGSPARRNAAAATADRPAAAGNRRGIDKNPEVNGKSFRSQSPTIKRDVSSQSRKERLRDPGRRQAADHQLLFAGAQPASGGRLSYRPQQFQPGAMEEFPDRSHRAGTHLAPRQGKSFSGLYDRPMAIRPTVMVSHQRSEYGCEAARSEAGRGSGALRRDLHGLHQSGAHKGGAV